MRRKTLLLLVLAFLFGWTDAAQAQLWSGIIDPSRAIDWSLGNQGVAGGIPNRTTICATLNPGATAAAINAAIQGCPANQVVFLNAGTYTNLGPISFNGKSNVTLRGAGPDQTKLIFTSAGGCYFSSAICIQGSVSTYGGCPDCVPANQQTNWTGGYAKDTTQLTVASTTGIQAGQIVVVDQVDDVAETNGIIQANRTPFFATEGCPCPGRVKTSDNLTPRTQLQFLKVVSVDDATHITITPPIYMPNWRSSQNPQVWWWGNAASTATMDGIESLSIDGTGIGLYYNIAIENAYNNWVLNVRSLNAPRAHIGMVQSARNEIRNNYFYGTQLGAATSYGVESFATGDDLVINNIWQNVTTPLMGPSPGSIFAYNFMTICRFSVNPTWNALCVFAGHDSGGGMELFEGIQTNSFITDSPHGTSGLMTGLRNHFKAIDDAGSGYAVSTQDNLAITSHAFSRANNWIGNVLGTVGSTQVYEDSPWASATGHNSDSAVFYPGYSVTSAPNDTPLLHSMLRWGNWDAMTQTTRFVAAEIPTIGITFINGNAVPVTQVIPNSFFLTAKPSWWGSAFGNPPWPPIGPDVTGGDMPNAGGHAYKIPARLCWENIPADGSNTYKVFNANTCYGNTTPVTPTPPKNLRVQ